MSKNKKIAFAFLFALPLALAVVFYQHNSLKGVSSSTLDMVEAAQVLRDTESVYNFLNQAEVYAARCLASPGDSASLKSYRDSVAQLQLVLQDIGEQTKDDSTTQANFKKLADLIAKRVSQLNQAISSKSRNGSAASGIAGSKEAALSLDIGNVLGEISRVQDVRLDHQRENSKQYLRKSQQAVTFGGGLLFWLVGIGAFLLFNAEKVRVWAGVERRVHTKILQTLPIGVSVATDTGVVLYTNPAEDTLLDYTSGELIGKNANILHELEGAEGEPIVKSILDRLEAGKPWEGTLPVRRKDNTIQQIPSWVMNLEFPGKVYRVFIHRTA